MAAEKIFIEENNILSQTCSSMFKKRSGTTDKGKDYEHLYIANLVLKLIIDQEVENFYISSNDDSFGSFDDVVVEIKFKNRSETHAIQLKHVNKQILKIEQLNATSGNFSIEKYNKNFNKMEPLKQPIKMVLFTNCKLNTEKKNQFKPGKLIQCEQSKLIGSLAGCCHTFQANENNSEEYANFFRNFYLYTGQSDVEQLRTSTFEIFKTYFSNEESAFHEYIPFVTQWCMIEGKKFKLDKGWMKRMTSLCVFSSSIKPLSFVACTPVGVKEKVLQEAVLNFDLTVIDRKNFDKIEYAWLDVIGALNDINIEEARKVINRYQLKLSGIETKKNLFGKDVVKVSKLMWLLGKSPLVVEGCRQVYQTIKTCQSIDLIVLDDREDFNCSVMTKTELKGTTTEGPQKVLLFQKLSDLKSHPELYEKIVNNFTYSLEGQKEVALKHLKICEDVDNFITTDDIVTMLEGPLLIGNHNEVLPPSHIERKMTNILIDVSFLKNVGENTITLVTSVTNVHLFKRSLPDLLIKEIKNLKKIQKTNVDHEIYICKNKVSQEEFSALCKSHPRTQFHHFRYLDNHRLELRRSDNYGEKRQYVNELEKFRLPNEFIDYTIHESQYFNDTEQDINIICADPGMGKSTLMKSLKNVSCSSKWTIVIYARNHAIHFRRDEPNVEKFLKYILEVSSKKYTTFHQNVFKTMVQENQIQLIWDGLDEASDATLKFLLILIEAFSEQGIKQWLTSRNNLKGLLENTLGTFSRNITQFNDQDQQEYIKSRLRVPEEDLSETFSQIKNNIMAFPNYEILGIPLQIYMLTELFLNNTEKYFNLLGDVFTVVDLYEHFVEEKFNVLYRDKKEIELSNEQNYQNFEDEKTTKMNYYKSLAVTSYIYNSFIKKYMKKIFGFNRKIKQFLETIKNTGDDVGLIGRVTSNNDVEFLHNSYGEYFAALFLFENDASKARDKDFIFNSRYNNIRFFLDLMLCKNCKCFVAVIYKNSSLLEKCTDVELGEKDSIGRDILEVACAWNKSYPVVKKSRLVSEGGNFKRKWVTDNKTGVKSLDFDEISKKFYKYNFSVDTSFKKLLLFLPFLIPFYDGNQFKEEHSLAVLYYAIKFDFSMIFECVEKSLPLKKIYNDISSRNVLSLALYNRSGRILQKLFSEDRDYFEWDSIEELVISNSEIDEIFTFVLHLREFKIDIPNRKGQLLMRYACDKNLNKTLCLLIPRDTQLNVPDGDGKMPIDIMLTKKHSDVLKILAKVDADSDGRLPMHYACLKGDGSIVQLLLQHGARIDVPDGNGQLPIHYACEIGHLGIVKLLLANGMKVDVSDGDGRLPMHYACEMGRLDMVKLLSANGAKVDVPDGSGRMPMHYACKNYWHGQYIIPFLSEEGAKFDIPDREHLLPIHYACESGSVDMVIFLLSKGAEVNIPHKDGRLLIHFACQAGHFEIVELLVAIDAKVNVPDGDGRIPMHYVCESGRFDMVELLLTYGTSVYVQDSGGRLPIHYACKIGHLGILNFLLANGTELNVTDEDGRLPIHYACQSGHLGILKLLLQRDMNAGVSDGDGRQPIHYACENGRLDMVQLLLDIGVKVNIPDGDARLPIHYACTNYFHGERIVPFLITKGVELDVQDQDGWLPMHHACQSGNLDVVKSLVENGVEVNIPNSDGQLPMYFACKRRDINMIKLLVVYNAKLDIPDRNGRLLMHYACENQHLDLITLLVGKATSVDVPDEHGWLPMHYACQVRGSETAELLLAYGAKLNIPNQSGRLPIHFACESGNFVIVKLLLENGAEVSVFDGGGRLPIHYACRCGDSGTVKLLVAHGAAVNVADRDDLMPMHYACKDNLKSYDLVLFLLRNNAALNVPDRNDRMPIHYACERGNSDTVNLLLVNGAKIDVADGFGRLPTHYASEGGHLNIVKLLLANDELRS